MNIFVEVLDTPSVEGGRATNPERVDVKRPFSEHRGALTGHGLHIPSQGEAR